MKKLALLLCLIAGVASAHLRLTNQIRSWYLRPDNRVQSGGIHDTDLAYNLTNHINWCLYTNAWSITNAPKNAIISLPEATTNSATAYFLRAVQWWVGTPIKLKPTDYAP